MSAESRATSPTAKNRTRRYLLEECEYKVSEDHKLSPRWGHLTLSKCWRNRCTHLRETDYRNRTSQQFITARRRTLPSIMDNTTSMVGACPRDFNMNDLLPWRSVCVPETTMQLSSMTHIILYSALQFCMLLDNAPLMNGIDSLRATHNNNNMNCLLI